MSIFGNIVRAIFGHSAKAGTAAAAPTSSSGTSAAGTGKLMTKTEVEATIAKLAEEHREKYDWRHSIVDLMKLLKLDSSLRARRQLAKELGYTGKLDGSAKMNVWLHKEVLTKLADSGGVVPESLKHT
jgi:Domain of unknown function (DUF3597)